MNVNKQISVINEYRAEDRYADKVGFMRLPFVTVLVYFFIFCIIFSFSSYITVEQASTLIANSAMKLIFILMVLYTIFGQFGIKGVKGNCSLMAFVLILLLSLEALTMFIVFREFSDNPFDAMLLIASGRPTQEILVNTFVSWVGIAVYTMTYILFVYLTWVITRIMAGRPAYYDTEVKNGRLEEIELTAFLYSVIAVSFTLTYMPGKLPIDNLLKFIMMIVSFIFGVYFTYLCVGSILRITNFRYLRADKILFAGMLQYVITLMFSLGFAFFTPILFIVIDDYIKGDILFTAIIGGILNLFVILLYLPFERMLHHKAALLSLYRRRTIRGIFVILTAIAVIVSVKKDIDNAYIYFSLIGIFLLVGFYITWFILRTALIGVYGHHDGQFDPEELKLMERKGVDEQVIALPEL